MNIWQALPPGLRKRFWQAALVQLLLLAVVFLIGFSAGRWFEHGR